MTYQTTRTSHPAAPRKAALIVAALTFSLAARSGAQLPPPGVSVPVRMEADAQRKDGTHYFADGNVQVRYEDKFLRADHADYDSETGDLRVNGHVQFDSGMQHIQAEQGRYDVKMGTGTFTTARGTVEPPKQRSNPMVLLSTNPVYFEAKEVERLDEQTYRLHSAWMTVCLPQNPTWKFFAVEATLHVDERLALINSNFRILRVPLFYTPYASVPVGSKVRQSGFTVPDLSSSNVKGTVIGDSYYWAPADWFDAELGAEFYTLRGWAQYADVRTRPTEASRVSYSYFGVQDRGLNGGPSQGGHQSRFFGETSLSHGWRAVADVNGLSSLTFRLAFSTTYATATNSELVSAGFLTNNFNGYSFNFAAEQYRDFLSTTPNDIIQIRKTPEVRFDSVDQQPWKRWPFYFGFDSFSGANHRSDPTLVTPVAVERSEMAPHVTVPLHFGPWLGVTTSVTGRAASFGAQVVNGAVSNQSFVSATGEFTMQIQTPAIEKVWGGGDGSSAHWKHTVEPEIAYDYVTGVNDFSRFIRFDQYDTLTNTNNVEYGIIQRLFRKRKTQSAEQFLYWRVAQEYYIDPTFGGAVVSGQRNVFVATSAFTPFAFLDAPRHWSPIQSDFRITPGGRYDFQVIADYDPLVGRLTALGVVTSLRPYRESFFSFSNFDLRNATQPAFNQLGMRAGWGAMNRKGLNLITTINYDVQQSSLISQAFQVSYNGSCCGISFEYRRLNLGAVQTSNQFRFALLIANFGSFGTMRRQERLF